MGRFVEGAERSQTTLLPECLDDFIAEDNTVRIVDAFVEELELASLGFEGITPASTGRPSYHPAALLKIYIYGYLNRVQSSRRLERECQRNVELMWLTGRLAPDFKAIAEFRRSNGEGIRNVCRRFVMICRDLKLFTQAVVAIDGSKFKAVNSRDNNFTPNKIARRQEQIEQSIQRYLDALETVDRTQPAEVEAKTERLREKIETLREQMGDLNRAAELLNDLPEKQISLTDPDSRSMISQAKGTGVVGYNVQVAVFARHHLIVTHEVTNVGNDRTQLSPMAKAARDAMGKKKTKALADRGYFSAPEIKACDDAGIAALVPKSQTSGAKADGRFDRADFIYIGRDDQYLCPAGQRAIYRYTSLESANLLELRTYWSGACPHCLLRKQCTPAPYRRIRRWEHEAVLDRMQRRLDRQLDAMTIRRRTVEHVFGTLKHWMGSTHFQMRRLGNVSTEMSLHVLAYNLKRVMKILGFAKTLRAMKLAGA
ncbi:IS1182 family transposase [Paraburkholderia aromaticivorans]|uniref:IS5/IS1182 family transposase n=1 Tax=Paraburkholderia aromaticivorans TaxID=2026199 RepID=A0A248VWF2_9BURK|nr:IS1182 family transposase [Paraburkholderia aromaticivorans]ASW03354.1 IS5/IS1182 family transposase [Paraburkholderia aromaticivorans]